jgi:hypothetical protein
VEVDDDIESCAPEAECRAKVVHNPPRSTAAAKHDQLVETGMVPEHGGGCGFDDVGEPCVGIGAPERPYERRGEDDVADEPRPNQQDLQGSIVASSISITGMSSLIRYTR